LSRIEELIKHKNLKIYNFENLELELVFQQNDIKTVIHTATQYGRDGGQLSEIIEANIALPIKAIEAGMRHGLTTFINTDTYYNKYARQHSRLESYTQSKKILLLWLKSLSSQVKVVNVILEHMYGPFDGKSKFVERLIQDVALGRSEKVSLTHGHQKRDFVYIGDVVSAYMHIIDFAETHEFQLTNFEVGMGVSVEVRCFATLVKEMSKSTSQLGFGEIPYCSDEIMESKANIFELKNIGWEPKVSIEAGISMILNKYGVIGSYAK
jgi:nucleoside-diphosphate-sugar epimerase